MYNLGQAAAIAIIGGADGPTSIYVDSKIFPPLIIVPLVLLAVVIFLLVRSIIKKHKARTIVFSILIALIFIVSAALVVQNFAQARKRVLEIEKMLYPDAAMSEENRGN